MTYLEKMENLVEEGKEMKIMEIILETISFWQVKKKIREEGSMVMKKEEIE